MDLAAWFAWRFSYLIRSIKPHCFIEDLLPLLHAIIGYKLSWQIFPNSVGILWEWTTNDMYTENFFQNEITERFCGTHYTCIWVAGFIYNSKVLPIPTNLSLFLLQEKGYRGTFDARNNPSPLPRIILLN